ncbi:MAG: hypothetical protein ACRDHP_19795, partial [Ktedonobacterales bacterium]
MSSQSQHARTQPAAPPDLVPASGSPTSAPSAPAPLRTLQRSGEVVTAIGAALALAPERLASAEALDRLEVDTDVPFSTFDAWDAATISAWFADLGPDLRIDLTLSTSSENSGVSVSLRSGREPAKSLADFLESARQHTRDAGDELVVSVRLAVAKARALEQAYALLASRPEYLGTPDMLARTKVAVFYSAAAFHRLLSMHALADWERLGLARADGRAVVVLCDRPGYLAGVALEVLGAHEVAEPRWLTLSRAAFR